MEKKLGVDLKGRPTMVTARGVSAAQIALAWLIGRPTVTSLIIGGRTEAQFRDNLACVAVKLTDEERARLDAVSQPPLRLVVSESVGTSTWMSKRSPRRTPGGR